MHAEAFAFVAEHAHMAPVGGRVLEIGAYDVNGSVRPLFPHAGDYIGLDIRGGPGVDVQADGADWPGDGRPFDAVVSTEALEHAADPGAVVANARKRLKPGGVLLLTLAYASRTPHGNNGGPLLRDETYTHIDRADVQEWLADWDDVHIEVHPKRGDLYATARKPVRKVPEGRS